MKILLVSFYFPPFNAIGAVRAGKLAKELVAAGHEVRVLTAQQQLLPQSLPLEVPEELITRTRWWNVNGLPLALFGRQQQRYRRSEAAPSGVFAKIVKVYRTLLNIPDGQIGWYPHAVRSGKRLIATWSPDIIYASAPPFTGLMVARRLAQYANVPWVGELRDLWTDNYYADWPAWRRAIEVPLERRVLSSSAGLVTVSDPLANRLREKYDRPVAVIPNGFDPDDYPRGIARSDADVLRIVYTGTIYPGRQDPTPLFSAVKSLGDEGRKIRIEFYGRTLPGILQLAERYGLENQVNVHAEVPFLESAQLQASADILLLLQWNSAAEPGVFTSKLFEYLGARRPVLAVGLPIGVAPDLIRDRNAGSASDDPAELATRLSQWLTTKAAAGVIPSLPESVGAGLSRAEQFAPLFTRLEEWRAGIGISRERRRVAVFVPRLAIGGTEQHLLDILPRIDRLRFAVTVVTTRGPGPLDDEMRRRGIPVVHARSNERYPLSLAGSFFGIASFLRHERPDIVHFFLPEAYLIGGFCAVLFGRRHRVMSRRSLNRYHRRRRFSATIERWLHRRMDVVLANSNAVASELQGEGVTGDRLRTIYSGVDVSAYADIEPIAARRELALADDAMVFVCVANLIPYKGHRDMLDAFVIAAPDLPDNWLLLVVGRDDGIGTELRNRAQMLGLEQNIRWFGERTDIPNILKASDIAVLASHEEGLPKSILEAMAAGLPSVVTGVGGTPEAVIDDVTGKVVEVHDIAALANALVELANDPRERVRFGRAANSHMDQKFRLETCVTGYEKIYDSLLVHPEAVSGGGTSGSTRVIEPDSLV